MNIDVSKLAPGTPGVSHGSGIAGELIRHATESWAGHAFVYIGDGMIVQGQPPVAAIAPAASHDDAVWAFRMWDSLGWDDVKVKAAQLAVVARAHALVGCAYDFPAYAGFALEAMHLAKGSQLDPVFKLDLWRVCSALVSDCEDKGGVPQDWAKVLGKGPGRDVNLVSPAMLLDLWTMNGWL
jgi:hypothetical protein